MKPAAGLVPAVFHSLSGDISTLLTPTKSLVMVWAVTNDTFRT